jgi:molecular chaperone HtpG
MIFPKAPENIKECLVYKELLEKSKPDDGLIDKVSHFIQVASPLLDLIVAGPFKEYTLHNRDHAKKVLHIIGVIIGDNIKKLSVLELAILVYSSYLHDLGMCLTSTERKRIIESQELIDVIHGWPELQQQLNNVRLRLEKVCTESEQLLLETEIYQLQEAAICSLLRPLHASKDRYLEVIRNIKKELGRNDLFEINNVSFEDYLIDICVSHNLAAGVLSVSNGLYNDRFPRDLIINNESFNSQYCAALLRLADILDFDRERTPHILFESLGIYSRTIPGAEVSLKEWNKHMAVHSMEILEEELVVIADTHHPAIECAIKEFCLVIENELRDTIAITKKNPPHILDRTDLSFPSSVRPRIRSVGYTYKDIAFRLNQYAVMNLLMGEQLYSKRFVAIRELLQNAIDACAARKIIEKDGYEPEINLQLINENGCEWLEITDNGIGMDEYVLSNYFFKVGNHYYDSPEFLQIVRNSGFKHFSAISRFGVGVISTFMIGDWLDIFTRNKYSPRNDYKGRNLRVDARGSLAFVIEDVECKQGTVIKVRLKYDDLSDFWNGMISYLKKTVLRPIYPININIKDFKDTLNTDNYYQLRENAFEILGKMHIEPVVVNIERWSNYISGVVILLFGKKENGELSYKKFSTTMNLRLGKDITPNNIIKGYEGNRVTVDGFLMKMSNITSIFSGRQKIPLIMDISVNGNPEVIYNLPRERIIGNGILFIRKCLNEAISIALKELGIYEKLSEETKRYVDQKGLYHHISSMIDDELLEKVRDILPKSKWPEGIHKKIAEELKLSNNIVRKALMIIKEQSEENIK